MIAAHGPRIDAHHHLWRYTPEEFAWISDSMSTIRRDYLPADLEHELAAAGIDAAIAVQARTTLAETDFLLACAAQSAKIAGVVGWFPLTNWVQASLEHSSITDLRAELNRITANSLLVGFREIAQGQPSGFFDQPAFNDGIREITARNLTFDILVYANQIEEATRFIDRHPNQRFILDHAAKPPIASHQLEPWRSDITKLGRRQNVVCKLSGLVTEADWRHWSPEQLAPYIDVCVSAFSPSRLLAGSDWPVCLVASSYTGWWQTLRDYFAPFTHTEQAAVFGGNAQHVYQLPSRANA